MTFSTKRSYENGGGYQDRENRGGYGNKGNYGDRNSGYGGDWKSQKWENHWDIKDHPEDSFENTESIKKNFYVESLITSQRSHHEVDAFRRENEISVTGAGEAKPVQGFEELEVPDYVMEPIRRNKFEAPTPIQAQSWPIALAGNDMVGIAQTGSGKTFAFVLPAILHIKNQRPLSKQDGPIALVLCPTRELCQQTAEVATEFTKDSRLRVVSVYGGSPKHLQLREIQRGVELVIATPGRLLDYLDSRKIRLNRVSYLVLDEADRMLDMGFEPQIRQIIKKTRPDRQTLMFSATWPKDVHKMADDFLSFYTKVNIGCQDLSANHKITQIIHMIQESEKIDLVCNLLADIMREEMNKTIIFVETKKNAERLCVSLHREGFPTGSIHGDKKQFERDRALADFKNGRRPILIATDVASRGIDIRDIKYVINFDYASNSEDYVHRIGRSARSNETGTAHTFFTPQNGNKARDLIKVLEEAGQNVPQKLLQASSHSYGPSKFQKSRSHGFFNRNSGKPASHSHKKF